MTPKYRYYLPTDELAIRELILHNYKWNIPSWGISRHEFAKGIHPGYLNVRTNWRRTTGLWEEKNGKLIAVAISSAYFGGDAFFIFDNRDCLNDRELLTRMFDHAITHQNHFNKETWERELFLRIPEDAKTMQEIAESMGFIKTSETEPKEVMVYNGKPFPLNLPDGYQIWDGRKTPDFYITNAHQSAFHNDLPVVDNAEKGFHELRQSPCYRPELDLCIIDKEEKPVAMAIIWYHEGMPYCELEPLAVAWWRRRIGLGRALLFEASNRVLNINPKCKGMRVDNSQPFYTSLGFKLVSQDVIWKWSKKM